MPLVLAVRRRELNALVRAVPFLALPREEVDRLHAAIEVVAVDSETPPTTELRALHGYIAVHHNYTWLTFPHGDAQHTLLLSAALPGDGPAPLFLGEEMSAWARREIERRLDVDGGCEVRLAGMLQEAEGVHALPRVGLLWVARLASRATRYSAGCCGHMELRAARSRFDPPSQVVIDHLAAL